MDHSLGHNYLVSSSRTVLTLTSRVACKKIGGEKHVNMFSSGYGKPMKVNCTHRQTKEIVIVNKYEQTIQVQ